jgi:2-iminoacetate synthase ThiH
VEDPLPTPSVFCDSVDEILTGAGGHHRMTRAEMERVITDAGFVPRQRRTLCEAL